MKILVIYESMFGNTRQIADAIADGIEDTDLVSVVNVNDITDIVLANSDAIVVGAPTHAHSLSCASTRDEAVREAADPKRSLMLELEAPGTGVREWLASAPPMPVYFAAFDTRRDVAHFVSGAASGKIDHLLHTMGGVRLVDPQSFLVNTHNQLDVHQATLAREWGTKVAKEVGKRTVKSLA